MYQKDFMCIYKVLNFFDFASISNFMSKNNKIDIIPK